MTELYEQFLFLLNAVWRRRMAAILVAWAVCLMGWWVVITMPNSYTSTTRIFVDTSNALRPLLKGLAVENDVNLELELMKVTLMSRQNLRKVARLTDLDIAAESDIAMETLLEGLKNNTEITADGTNVVEVSFTDQNPEAARDIVQALTTTFIESNLGHSRQDIERASEFLDQRIQAYERQLERAEQNLAQFKRDQIGRMPDQSNYQLRYQELRDRLAEAEALLKSSLTRRNQIRQDLAAGPAANTALQIFELEQELEDLMSRYTERHPEVVKVQRRLDELKKELPESSNPAANGDQQITDLQAFALDAGVPGSAYEELKLELAEQDANIEIYSDRVRRARTQLEELDRLAADVPAVEAELAKLTRDYEVIKLKHAELLSRREQARLSSERQAGVDGIQFRIIDPPQIPTVPNGPSRFVLLAFVLLFGLGSGGIFALALAYVVQTFSDPSQLREAYSLPVLGTVSKVETGAEHTVRLAQFATFAGLLAGLLCVFAILVLIDRVAGLTELQSIGVLSEFYDATGVSL